MYSLNTRTYFWFRIRTPTPHATGATIIFALLFMVCGQSCLSPRQSKQQSIASYQERRNKGRLPPQEPALFISS